MHLKQANRRFHRTLVPATAVFLASSFALGQGGSSGWLSAPLVYALALIAISALLLVFWTFWRYLREIDEYLRLIQTRAVLVGTAVILSVSTAWGFLEQYTGAPNLPLFWLTPLFWIVYVVAAAVISKREGVQI